MKLPPDDPVQNGRHEPVQNGGSPAPDAVVMATLDAFLGSQNQSYQQFMDNFTQLSAGDVSHSSQNQNGDIELPPLNANNNGAITIATPHVPLATNVVAMTTPVPVTTDEPVLGVESVAADDLEEETLEDGSRRPSVLNSLESPSMSRVQFDNFVTNDSDSEDEAETSAYVASFDSAPNLAASSSSEESKNPSKLPDTNCENETERSFERDQESDDEMDKIASETDESDIHAMPSDQKWSLNPGEVEDDVTMTSQLGHVMKVRVPGVEYRMKTMEECIQDARETQPSSDLVEPFSLDAEFDYDHVALTPKFSREEMDYIQARVREPRGPDAQV